MTEQIIKNIEIILDEDSTYVKIKKSIDNLYLSFSQISNLTGNLKRAEHASFLPDGEALSPQTAAGCIFDYVRTTKFLRGIKKGIDSQLNSLNKKRVRIMYVGTGPFAPLLLPLIPLYDESLLEINVIDFHQQSIDSLNSIIAAFGFINYFDEILIGDAVKYQNNKNKVFDIIIIETMQKGLCSEPQVALTNHFSQFLSADGILIPEEIKITAVLANLRGELTFSRNKWRDFRLNIIRNNAISNRIILKDIFILDKNVRGKYNLLNLNNNKVVLPSVRVQNKIGKVRDLILLTEIKILHDIILSEEDDTGLTKLYFDKDIPPIKKDIEIFFSYQLGGHPKFIIELLEGEALAQHK